MHKSTIKPLAAVANAKHTYPRPALENIRITYGDDTATAESTDSRMLMRTVERIERGNGTAHPEPGSVIMLSGSAAADAIKLCPGNKDNQLRVTLGKSGKIVCDGNAELDTGYNDLTYPKTEQVWPDRDKVQVTFTVNAKLLKIICDAAISQQRNKYSDPSVTLNVIDEKSAAIFELNRSHDDSVMTDGLIMPMRI